MASIRLMLPKAQAPLARPLLTLPSSSCNSKQTCPYTSRPYATQSSTSNSRAPRTRRAVTVSSDDGRINWGELSTREKAARSTQQSFNFLVILAGVVMTCGVSYYVYTDILSPVSKTNHFNRAVRRVKSSDACLALLGPASSLQFSAFQETPGSGGGRMFRNRSFMSTESKDKAGVEHLHMNINVEGKKNRGVVKVHLTRRPGEEEFEYETLVLQVRGQQVVYLEDARERKRRNEKRMFGVRWW